MNDARSIPNRFTALALGIVLALVSTTAVAATDADEEKDPAKTVSGLKAALIYHFINFRTTRLIRWPDEAFANASAPAVVGVVGKVDDALFRRLLVHILHNKRVGAHPIRLDFMGDLPAADDSGALAVMRKRMRVCHVLFITAAEMDRLPEILDSLGTAPILTVSDAGKFAERGGMVQFVLVDENIRLEINRWATKRAEIGVHGSLLRNAKEVHEDPPKETSE